MFQLHGTQGGNEDNDDQTTGNPPSLQGKKREKDEDDVDENQDDNPTLSPSQLQGKKRDDDNKDEDDHNSHEKRPNSRPSKSKKKKKTSKDESENPDDEYEDEDDSGGHKKSEKKSKKDKGDESGGKDVTSGDDTDDGDNGDGGHEDNPSDREPTSTPQKPVDRPSLPPITRPTLSPAATMLPTILPSGELPGPTQTRTESPTEANDSPAAQPSNEPPSLNTREFELLDFVLTLAYPVNETGKLRDSMESIFFDGLLIDGLEAVIFPLPEPTKQRNTAQGYSFANGKSVIATEAEDVTVAEVHEDQTRLLEDVDFIQTELQQRMNDPNLMILDLSLSEAKDEGDNEDRSPSDAGADSNDRSLLVLIAGLLSIVSFVLCVLVVYRRYQITRPKVGEAVPEEDLHETDEWKRPQTIPEEDDEDEDEEGDDDNKKEIKIFEDETQDDFMAEPEAAR
ncbi:hypothetical protein FisN_30Lh102 [Fistulifera solaris]|uniref:Uncharacterized protein n=1 Tax=Fistulifera solaris TaxID=1519565 RepID=A0A1Z5JJ49_FISSO|nr:hypothetical protein FisN_30Lh102 [Fistulifera solaris]|eukprot:GAX13808.1 hypothetical protein FisN_30Lh102 [Fistulifera solaris]